ncbi:hypothetical protein GUITHDRAFT_121290 [Guillardia theta CCMP2712]|uniref:Regulator of chromosome condensation n=1 Tax=Guillardia theta (strain CCMP2712) TaxID=905079 RepID=L1I9F4_GUITC|nr:hypothetical protein GUITHDRAFT_121290 [Guillardia theta CCMP2712]EKX32539.1 hypothetical protein GUITHDRAFT_121290 [Guillardia theta CCMP2712]|eukprot:XP_005819519.1 hypothetical protein GUITHDRAFT_121290 [Guillardia theta CCMP2712]
MSLLLAGCTSWEQSGRNPKKGETPSGENLNVPTVFAPALKLKFDSIFTGPSSTHCIALTSDGSCYSFGRNETGQLGQGDKSNRSSPTLIKALENETVVNIAVGKTHTIFLGDAGQVWCCGTNKFGECGIGRTSEVEDKPKPVNFGSKIVHAGAGAEFSIAVNEEGKVFSFGHPEYGALGHGTDGRFIIATGRQGFREVSTPTQITQWHLSDSKGKEFLGAIVEPPVIQRVYCGNKHTLAVGDDGSLWAWGYNGYGRLGLNDPHDRKRPCKVEFFQGPHAIKNPDLVVAGGASSGAVDGIGQLYTWGQIKKVGESQVRPHAEHNLGGWRVRSLSFGNESFAISCDGNKEPRRPWVEGCESIPHVITWGTSKYGELGYGGSKKSSANPDIVSSLTGFTVKKVAAGVGHTCFLLDKDVDESSFPVYDPPADEPSSGKRGAGAAKGAAAAKKAKKKK